jgi:MoaA/NifB/PqqE/SkfB family radical SAM enzyme
LAGDAARNLIQAARWRALAATAPPHVEPVLCDPGNREKDVLPMPCDPAANTSLNHAEILEKKTVLASRPVLFNLDTTGICNIDPPCLFCTLKSQDYNYKKIDALQFEKYGDFLHCASKVIDCSFGEPLTRSDFLKIALSILERGQVFHFSTNGLLLRRAVAERLAPHAARLGIIVSVNAAHAETYARITGKDFSKLLGNIRDAVAVFGQPGGEVPLSLSMIVMRMNQAEVADFLHLARDLGVPRVLLRHLFETDYGSTPRNDFGYAFHYDREILRPEEYAAVAVQAKALAASLGLTLAVQWEAEQSEIAALAEPDSDIPCLFPWKFLFAQEHTALAYPCCYIGQAVGGIGPDGLEAVWNGPVLAAMRQSLARGELPGFCLEHGHTCPLVLERRRGALDRLLAAPLAAAVAVGGAGDDQLVRGWHGVERIRGRYNLFPRSIRWTKERAVLALDLTGKKELRVTVFEPFAGAAAGHLAGAVVIAGQPAQPFTLAAKGWHTLRFPLPEAGRAGNAAVELRVDAPRPRAAEATSDRRFLGLAVARIEAV